eukprot:c32149_g1_i1 orf=4-156(-)
MPQTTASIYSTHGLEIQLQSNNMLNAIYSLLSKPLNSQLDLSSLSNSPIT